METAHNLILKVFNSVLYAYFLPDKKEERTCYFLNSQKMVFNEGSHFLKSNLAYEKNLIEFLPFLYNI